MLFRIFSLPEEVSFQNTIQKHDANSCTNSLLDRIRRLNPITFYRYSCAKWRLLHPSLVPGWRKQPRFTEVGEDVPNATCSDQFSKEVGEIFTL